MNLEVGDYVIVQHPHDGESMICHGIVVEINSICNEFGDTLTYVKSSRSGQTQSFDNFFWKFKILSKVNNDK